MSGMVCKKDLVLILFPIGAYDLNICYDRLSELICVSVEVLRSVNPLRSCRALSGYLTTFSWACLVLVLVHILSPETDWYPS